MNPRTVEVYEFMRRAETAELVAEISNTGDSRIPSVETKRGAGGGTYVSKELVYAYAMWISPSFNLKVIRAFDDMVTGRGAPTFNVPWQNSSWSLPFRDFPERLLSSRFVVGFR
jgi:hypothetical protein